MSAEFTESTTKPVVNKEKAPSANRIAKYFTKKVITIAGVIVTLGTIVMMSVALDNRYVKADSETQHICTIKNNHKSDVDNLKSAIKKSEGNQLNSILVVQESLVKLNERLDRKINEDDYNRIEQRILVIEERHKEVPMSATVKEVVVELRVKKDRLAVQLGYKK